MHAPSLRGEQDRGLHRSLHSLGHRLRLVRRIHWRTVLRNDCGTWHEVRGLGQERDILINIPSASVQLRTGSIRKCIVRGYWALAHTRYPVHPLSILLEKTMKVYGRALFQIVCDLHLNLGQRQS